MFRSSLLVVTLLSYPIAFAAEDKPLTEEQKKRIEELKQQIKDKKDEVAKLESELEKLQPLRDREQAQIPAAARERMVGAFPNTPKLPAFDKGEIGYLETNAATTVGQVVDERSVVLVLRQFAPGAPRAVKTNVLVTGFDTSNLTDGKEWQFRGTVYVAGNAKVGSETMLKLVVFEFLPGERSAGKK